MERLRLLLAIALQLDARCQLSQEHQIQNDRRRQKTAQSVYIDERDVALILPHA